MASSDLNELFSAARSFAELMLSKEGEFIPFGVSMDVNGQVAMVAGDVGDEHPQSAQVIVLLQDSFRESAMRDGAIRAAGVCLDVRLVPPGGDARSDAICVRLAHISGEAIEVYVPYSSAGPGMLKFGDVFATGASEFQFVGP